MTHDRLIQAVAGVVLIGTTVACGFVLPRLTEISERHVLRYTNVAVEGAPPVVALGTAIGALRGVIVDYLWIKVHLMKQEGLYYEVMADSDLITRLQPHFSAVWAFHGHNMAYPIDTTRAGPTYTLHGPRPLPEAGKRPAGRLSWESAGRHGTCDRL